MSGGANPQVVEDGVAKVPVAIDLVAIAAAILGAGEVSLCDEFGDDALSSAIGDTDSLCDVAGAAARIAGDAQQHVSVVGSNTHVGGLSAVAARPQALSRF